MHNIVSTNVPQVDPYLSIPTSPLLYTQPDFDILEYQKTPIWYADNVRYFSTFYNQSKSPFNSLYGLSEKNDSSSNNLNAPFVRGEAEEMKINFAYYFGEQPNIDFNFLTQDITGNTFQNPWIRGKHAAKLMDFMKGPALKMLSSVKFSAQTLSRDAITRKGELFDKMMLAFEMKQYLNKMREMGVDFAPHHEQFDIMDELDDFMKNYKDRGEEFAVNVAMDIYTKNNAKYVYLNAWLHTIVGGIGAIYNYVNNGQVVKKHIPCYNLIWDSRGMDNDFNNGAQFVGFVEYITPAEIMSRYRDELSVADMQTIKALAKKQNGWDAFIGYYSQGINNFNWYQYQQSQLLVACVTMFWIGPRDLRYVKFKDRNGNERLRRLNNYTQDNIIDMRQQQVMTAEELARLRPQGDIRGDYKTDDVHKATLIGNWKLVDYGYNKNTVREWKNKGNPELPIKLFVPNMTMGRTRATMGMLRDNQNEIDRLAFRLRGITAQYQGKVPVFDASQLQAPYNDPYVLADVIKDVNLLVINRANGMDNAPGQPLLEYADFTMAAGIINDMISLKKEEQQTMEEILNLSKIALGQQDRYISQGTQENTTAISSMGTAYLFDGFMHLMELDTRYGANVQKMLAAIDGEDEVVQFYSGEKGVQFSTVTQDMRFEDCLIFIKINDMVDEKGRARILQYALNWSQVPELGIKPLDIVKLEKAQTYSEMVRILELSLKKQQMAEKQRAVYENMINAITQEKNNQAMLDQEAMRQQGADQRTKSQVEGKLAGDLLKHSAAVHKKAEPEAA